MSVSVRLFASLREVVGMERLDAKLEAPKGAAQTAGTVGDVWAWLVAEHPELGRFAPSAAVNAEWAFMDAAVQDGDEVAFLPPVSGG